ncbi:PDR/VanB family oxidoreductase [Paraburkholderia sp. J12]|uniref:PDR/VanB family oxidoreductase n=1 Tax=Paraburkholderia sp. J12 TaxID=2805432 RepID=UPI002ABE7644|nr:PDR/VanB family oxidoreductase [Paraburkholderia sp. J12]
MRESITVYVHERRAEALDVVSFDLRPVDGGQLPQFAPGAHVDVFVPSDELAEEALKAIRQYSLCNDPVERHRYVIGVGLNSAGRGGSRALHERVRVGDRLRISAPRNHFALTDQSHESVLIAGGIGITPLLAMARQLDMQRRPWKLYYCVRTPARAAFAEPLLSLRHSGSVEFVFSGTVGGGLLNLDEVVRNTSPDTHFYCCGPGSLLDEFQRATQLCPQENVHFERFSAPPETPSAKPTNAKTGTFTVHLARSGGSVTVTPGQSILEALEAAGHTPEYSCRTGICGACETRVVDGRPAHRDCVLSSAEAEKGDRMMICVSGCLGDSLHLDL